MKCKEIKLIISYNDQKNSRAHITCSAGRLNEGETVALEETPEPDSISLRMPLIPRRSKALAPRGDPLAQVERSRIKPCICE